MPKKSKKSRQIVRAAHKSSKPAKKSLKHKVVKKSVRVVKKKVVRASKPVVLVRRSAMLKTTKTDVVAVTMAPWSKVTKYKKIKNDRYFGDF